MLGSSPAFRRLSTLIDKYACCDASVLIEGETGTGKEVAARTIHYASARRNRPFVPVNCGAIPESLIESELFGHKRGSFTDARSDQPGVVTVAHGGTLFLDEVDSLPLKAQVALLRFLQDYEYTPVGSRAPMHADVRVIAATNANLRTLVAAQRFRMDLYYRLSVLSLHVPPLRDRGTDVVDLAEHFLQDKRLTTGQQQRTLDAASRRLLLEYSWPGNIRELENVMYRAALLSEGPYVSLDPPDLGLDATIRPEPGQPADEATSNFRDARRKALEEFERRFVSRLLSLTSGNVSRAAELAGKERRSFGKLVKKHRIDRAAFRPTRTTVPSVGQTRPDPRDSLDPPRMR
jgi:DNA-binding NtrC family response regulator